MIRIRLSTAIAALCIALAASFGAQAAGSAAAGDDAASLAARQEFASAVQNFQLTPDFLAKWKVFNREAAEHPCTLSPMAAMQKLPKAKTLDQAIAIYGAQPGMRAALAKAGLSAREELLGTSVLFGAAMKDMAKKYPDMVKKGEISGPDLPISDHNMNFYHRHAAEIREQNHKLGREMMKRNGGKLPACMRQ